MAKDVRSSVTTFEYKHNYNKSLANENKDSKCKCNSPCDEQETECGTFKLK